MCVYIYIYIYIYMYICIIIYTLMNPSAAKWCPLASADGPIEQCPKYPVAKYYRVMLAVELCGEYCEPPGTLYTRSPVNQQGFEDAHEFLMFSHRMTGHSTRRDRPGREIMGTYG